MRKTFSTTRKLIGLCVLVLSCISFQTGAYADFSALGVSPTRVVIGPNDRSGSINLHNNSSSVITYRMKLVEMGLDNDGSFRVLGMNELPAGHLSAVPLVRFSPRQIRLKPGDSQVVRVIVRRRASLGAGEYRSHLNIQALPLLDNEALGNLARDGVDVAVVTASSPTTVGITIPVIVRHSETNASITVKEVKYVTNGKGQIKKARVLLGRTGNRSAYGEIQLVDPVADNRVLGVVRGYAIYSPYGEEWVDIMLSEGLSISDPDVQSGIRVRFVDREKGVSTENVFFDSVVDVDVVR